MSAANLRLAAATMRREEEPVFDALADLLDHVATEIDACQRSDRIDLHTWRLEQPHYALPLAVAATYLDTGQTAHRPAGSA